MNSSTYKVGIIGLGQIAWSIDNDPYRNKIWSHALAYTTHPKTKIVAVCDIDENRIDGFKKKYVDINDYTDYKDMLHNEELDIISICVPTDYHSKILEEIVTRSKVRAIFCEKPMATSDSMARKMVNLCNDHGIVLAVNYMRRWDKRNHVIKETIKKEYLGSLLSIVAYGATAMLTSASHLIDLVLFFAQEPQWICGDIQTDFIRKVHGQEDHGGMAFIKFKNGAYAFLKCTSKSPNYYMFELDLLFSEGRITISDDGRNYTQYKFDNVPTSSGSGYKSLVETPGQWNNGENERMLNAIDDIIHCIETNGTPISSGSNAVDVLKVIGLVQKSYSNGNETLAF